VGLGKGSNNWPELRALAALLRIAVEKGIEQCCQTQTLLRLGWSVTWQTLFRLGKEKKYSKYGLASFRGVWRVSDESGEWEV
jgi:hypothetical protein